MENKTMCFRLHFWQSVFGVHYPVKHTKSVSEKRKALLFTDTLPRPGSQSMCIYLVPDLLSAYPSELVKPFRADAISTSVLRRIRVSAPNAITGSGSLQPRPSARRVWVLAFCRWKRSQPVSLCEPLCPMRQIYRSFHHIVYSLEDTGLAFKIVLPVDWVSGWAVALNAFQ